MRHRADLDGALGVWVEQLRLVLIDAGHNALAEIDDRTYEFMIVRAAWHEWGHALSVARAGHDDIAAGERLMQLAPDGVREFVRRAGYRRREYIHEACCRDLCAADVSPPSRSKRSAAMAR